MPSLHLLDSYNRGASNDPRIMHRIPSQAKSEELVAPVWIYVIVSILLVICAVVCILGVTGAHSMNGYGFIIVIIAWGFLIVISGVYQEHRRRMKLKEKQDLGKI